jgi:hypothetical protein
MDVFNTYVYTSSSLYGLNEVRENCPSYENPKSPMNWLTLSSDTHYRPFVCLKKKKDRPKAKRHTHYRCMIMLMFVHVWSNSL